MPEKISSSLKEPPFTIRRIIAEASVFLIPYAFILIVGLIIVFTYEKGAFLLWLNGLHAPASDVFFKYATHLGDGLVVLAALAPIAYFSYRLAYQVFIGYISSGLIAQIFKRIFDEPRPKAWFGDSAALNFVEGVKVYSNHSFPSGHSATAFAVFLILAIWTKSKAGAAFFFSLALIAALSRVYILQHFLWDVCAGSLIGVLVGVATVYFVNAGGKNSEKSWLDGSLRQTIEKNRPK